MWYLAELFTGWRQCDAESCGELFAKNNVKFRWSVSVVHANLRYAYWKAHFCIFTTFKNNSDSYTLFFGGVHPTASSLSSVSSSPLLPPGVIQHELHLANPGGDYYWKGGQPYIYIHYIYIYTLYIYTCIYIYIHVYIYTTNKALTTPREVLKKKNLRFLSPNNVWTFIAFGMSKPRNQVQTHWSLKVPTPGRPQLEILANPHFWVGKKSTQQKCRNENPSLGGTYS